MNQKQIRAAVEAMLFAYAEPIGADKLAQALQLPTACRVDDEHAKYALRVAASKLGFQKKVANMPKQPFITPLTVWLQTDLYYDASKRRSRARPRTSSSTWTI